MGKKGYIILLGIVLFAFSIDLIRLAFKKSPEEIASQECLQMLNTSNALGVNAPITVYVEGVPYRCN